MHRGIAIQGAALRRYTDATKNPYFIAFFAQSKKITQCRAPRVLNPPAHSPNASRVHQFK
jgi:hypothetical protein